MDCQVRDMTMHYEEAGTGTPLLVLDGWGSNAKAAKMGFEPLFEGRSGWRRIYPDLPGHGASPMPEWVRGPDDVLDVLFEFMDAVAPGGRFAIAGASWGAYLALGLIHHRPTSIGGVMFDIPAFEFGAADKGPLPVRQIIRSDPDFVDALQPSEQWMQGIVVAQSRPVLDELRTIFANVAPLDPAVQQRLWAKSFSFDATVLSQPFPAPALFVTGRQDHIVGYGKAWSTLDDFPRATFVVLDRAGHLLDVEQIALQHALVSEWLDRVDEYAMQNVLS
jgi:pimeloyl-ACP methyl ester carboxylesterase